MIKTGSNEMVPVKSPETLATAIRIGAPVSWKKAVNAIRNSGGTAETVTDEEILATQKLLARVEGIFVEPASASAEHCGAQCHSSKRPGLANMGRGEAERVGELLLRRAGQSEFLRGHRRQFGGAVGDGGSSREHTRE